MSPRIRVFWTGSAACYATQNVDNDAQAKSPLGRSLKHSPVAIDETISSDDPCGCLAQ